MRHSSSPPYMTWQLDLTAIAENFWPSPRLLTSFHLTAWQSNMEVTIVIDTMEAETRTYPGSDVPLQIGINKLYLMGRHRLLLLSQLESTGYSAWTSPVPGIYQ